MDKTQCPICGKIYAVQRENLGKKVQCKSCTTIFFAKSMNPSDNASIEPSAEKKTAGTLADGYIYFKCRGCAQVLKTVAQNAGRQAVCNKCKTPNVVPNPDAVDNKPKTIQLQSTDDEKPQSHVAKSFLDLADADGNAFPGENKKTIDRIDVPRSSGETSIIYHTTSQRKNNA